MFALNVFILTALISSAYGMVCDFDQDSILNKLTKNCPGPFGSSDDAYCCLNSKGEFYCCNFIEFAATYLIIGVVVLIVLSILCSCICCLCCPCCWIYKRRHAGMGRNQPAVVTQYAPYPPTVQYQPVYPLQNAGVPPPGMSWAQPGTTMAPPDSSAASPYGQQYSYNPNYK